MTDRAKEVSGNEFWEMMRQLAKTIKVGDWIELRSQEGFPIDDEGIPPEPPKISMGVGRSNGHPPTSTIR